MILNVKIKHLQASVVFKGGVVSFLEALLSIFSFKVPSCILSMAMMQPVFHIRRLSVSIILSIMFFERADQLF